MAMVGAPVAVPSVAPIAADNDVRAAIVVVVGAAAAVVGRTQIDAHAAWAPLPCGISNFRQDPYLSHRKNMLKTRH